MSTPAVLLQAGSAIADMLHTEIGNVVVSLDPPQEIPPQNSVLLWWLYEVRKSEHLQNRPSQMLPTRPVTTRPAGLGLDLFYLMTPYTGSTNGDLLALGKAMQVLHDNPVLLVQNADGQVAEELRISMLPQELEEKARVWEALKLGYRFSVAYHVRAVRIDPERSELDVPVRTVQLGGG